MGNISDPRCTAMGACDWQLKAHYNKPSLSGCSRFVWMATISASLILRAEYSDTQQEHLPERNTSGDLEGRNEKEGNERVD
jgi:hypothetical protein